MRHTLLTIIILSCLTQLSACAKYKLAGSSKKKSTEVPDNRNNLTGDPGGNERRQNDTGIYESLDGALVLRAQPYRTVTGMQIKFTAQCFDNSNVIVSWSFADGAKAAGLDVGHAYQSPGNYRVTAVCTTQSGAIRSGYLNIEITQAGPQLNPNLNPSQNRGGCCDCGC